MPLLLLLPLAPAAAHSSGQLPHANLRADGKVVTLTWTAAADDAADVGVAIGLLPETAVDGYNGKGPFEDIPTPRQVRELSQSPALRDYLLDNVRVSQGVMVCAGTAEPAEDFITEGAELVFTCPEPVDYAEIRITMLHDRNPAYATYSVDGTEQYKLHTAALPEHTWDFTAARGSRSRGPAIGVAGGLITVVALSGLVLRRSPTRRRDQGRETQ
jgi:hypothetical protein